MRLSDVDSDHAPSIGPFRRVNMRLANTLCRKLVERETSEQSTEFRHCSRLPRSHPFDGTGFESRKGSPFLGVTLGREFSPIWPCCEPRQINGL